VTDISVSISDDPVSVSVSNAPGPSGASSFFKGMAAAWPPSATPTAGWIYTLPDPVPAGTPAGFLAGYGAQWDGSTWNNIGPVRGPAGPAGPQGVAGSAGSPGVAGANGTAATITVGSVTTGAAGTSASVVNAGTSSAAVLNITIPRGDAGAAGSAGAAGPQGPQGPAGSAGSAGAAATVSVGTVTTGAAGSSASVTNVGTSAAAVLNITIPRGDTGAAGVAGPAGAAGVAGPQGPAGAAGATGPAGSSGVISVTAPLTNGGTSSAAALSLSIGSGLSVVGGALVATGLTSVSWGDVTGKPTTFTPSAHASTHQTGGADAVASVVVTPSSLAADQNDWSIGTGDIFRVAGTAARNITGIAAGTSGLAILLVNVGSFALTLKHQSASSSAANRFTTPWAGDCILAANGGNAVLVYDSTTATWRVL
jgi:hypothetical protein